MALMLIASTLALAALFAYRNRYTNSPVEMRAMRSLKAAIRRGEDTPQRRVLALSRMM
jgi:hypothetical protein